jgi:hypothetical protein
MAFLRVNAILGLAILAIAACSKKDETPFVARVGDLKITPDEFRKRFELNPHLLQFKDINQAKIRFLGSLIAEKLLAAAARDQGFPISSRTQTFLDQINREAVIEEFYNDKAASKAHIDEQELREVYHQQRKKLLVQYTSFQNRQEALAFRQRVLEGEAFEAARSNFLEQPGNQSRGVDTLTVKWGNAESSIEEALYKLKPGEISEPLKALDEFYVARVLSATVEELGAEDDFLRKREKIEKMLKKRKAAAAFRKYFHQRMTGKKTSVPPQRFKYIVESLERAFAIGEKSTGYLRVVNPSPINETELRRAQQRLQANLSEVFVAFDDGATWTFKEFLQRLSVGRYLLDFSSAKSFRLSWRQAVITMIEQEYVYKEAVRAGVQKSSIVRDEAGIWRESVMAREYLQKLLLLDHAQQEAHESLSLTDEQVVILNETLASLLTKYEVEVDPKTFNALKVVNAGLLAFKTHFPGRLVVPEPLPLENLAAWQEKIREKLDLISDERAGSE